jgi:autotransporter adhesin
MKKMLFTLLVLASLSGTAFSQQRPCIDGTSNPALGNNHVGSNGGAPNQATGGNATASGINARATAQSATATGDSSLASGQGSVATGTSSTASGCLSTANGALSNASGYQSTANGYNSNASGEAALASGSGSRATGNFSSATGSLSNASGTNSVANGFNARATATNTTSNGANSQATAVNSSAYGAGAQANHVNSAAIGANTRTDAANQVAMGYRTVGQVADGRIAQDSFDAINGRQIWALQEGWDDRWTEINRRVDGMEGRIDAVGAQSAAMAQMSAAGTHLPVGKIAINLGYGQYGDAKAFAVGSKVRFSERTSGSLGLSSSSDGKLMIGAGFSITLP